MELRDLRIFQAIAEEASISGAARRLGYVQSNVTARLRKLEEELGVLLFHRNVKGISITEKGAIFRQYADSILQMADEAVAALRDDDKPSGTLRLGVVETVTCGNFMQMISAYQARHEQVSLRLVTGNPVVLMEKVKNYELDAAFVTGNLSSTDLVLDYVQSDEIVLLSGKDLEASSLSAYRWALSPEGCPFRATLEKWFREEGLVLHDIIEISSLETILSSVEEGIAITLLPKSVLTRSYEHLRTASIPQPFRYMETGLVRRKEKYLSQAYQAFRKLVQEQGL